MLMNLLCSSKRMMVLVSFVICLFFGVVANGDDWPGYLGPSGNGLSEESGWLLNWPEGGPRELWRFDAGLGFSSMSVVGGRVYTMGGKDDVDTVWCLDVETGKVIWKHSYACDTVKNNYPGPRTTPTVDEGKVYTVSRFGDMYCLDAGNGKVLWKKQLERDFGGKKPGWHFSASAVVVDEMVIVEPGGRGTSMVALNKNTGEVVWKAGDDKASYCTGGICELNGKKTLATMNLYGLVLRDVATGKEIWRFPWKTKYDVNASTPTVVGDRIFISSGYGHGGALVKIGESKPIWKHNKIKTHMMTCVLYEGKLYGFDEHNLTCIDFDSGKVYWSERLKKGSMIIAGGKLVVMSGGGELIVADATTEGFKPYSRAKVLEGTCWVAPTLSNGKIFCRTNEGKMVCLDVSVK